MTRRSQKSAFVSQAGMCQCTFACRPRSRRRNSEGKMTVVLQRALCKSSRPTLPRVDNCPRHEDDRESPLAGTTSVSLSVTKQTFRPSEKNIYHIRFNSKTCCKKLQYNVIKSRNFISDRLFSVTNSVLILSLRKFRKSIDNEIQKYLASYSRRDSEKGFLY